MRKFQLTVQICLNAPFYVVFFHGNQHFFRDSFIKKDKFAVIIRNTDMPISFWHSQPESCIKINSEALDSCLAFNRSCIGIQACNFTEIRTAYILNIRTEIEYRKVMHDFQL